MRRERTERPERASWSHAHLEAVAAVDRTYRSHARLGQATFGLNRPEVPRYKGDYEC
jgi:hypothetical protein